MLSFKIRELAKVTKLLKDIFLATELGSFDLIQSVYDNIAMIFIAYYVHLWVIMLIAYIHCYKSYINETIH